MVSLLFSPLYLCMPHFSSSPWLHCFFNRWELLAFLIFVVEPYQSLSSRYPGISHNSTLTSKQKLRWYLFCFCFFIRVVTCWLLPAPNIIYIYIYILELHSPIFMHHEHFFLAFLCKFKVVLIGKLSIINPVHSMIMKVPVNFLGINTMVTNFINRMDSICVILKTA